MSGRGLHRGAVFAAMGLIMVCCLVIAAIDDSGPRTESERIQSLSQVFACPECDGQSVAESNAAVASNIRDFIRSQVLDGATDDQIRDRLIESYGSDVLLRPPSDGVSSLIWILPVLVVVGGGAAVLASIRAGRGSATATDDDRALVAAARRTRGEE